MNVTSIDALGSLHFEFHVVFSGSLAILPLLPTVAVSSISDSLS